MPMNGKKLASLAAVGAGALALTSGKAEASTIIYSNILDQTVGFGYAASADFKTFTNIGGPFFSFTASSSRRRNHYSRILNSLGDSGVMLRFAVTVRVPNFFQTFSAGAVGSNDSFGLGGHEVAMRSWGSASTNVFGSAFTDKYLMFKFRTNSLTQFGWLEATLQLTDANSNDPADGPNLTIISYAYDTSGALLPAGDTGTPEPSTLAESGIAALVLGAEGLRRWRKARLIEP